MGSNAQDSDWVAADGNGTRPAPVTAAIFACVLSPCPGLIP